MTETLIEQLKPGQTVDTIFALRSKKLLSLSNGNGIYLAVVLGDKTGQLEGRVWESVYEIDQACRVGDIVKVQGQITEYKGDAQIQISFMSACQDCAADPGRFIPLSTLKLNTAKEKLFLLIGSLENQRLKSLLSLIFSDEDFLQSILTAPAAKRNHHAVIGGLLEHSLGIADAAGQIASVYPKIDRDLLVAGALLHDIGKVEEYSYGNDIDFTDEGRLLGHIVLGARLLEKYISRLPDFPYDLRLKLLHMIISHHGQYEWQSPKRPKFLEAAVLHHLDMIDAEADMFSFAVESRENRDNHWTGWIKGLNRYILCK
jgi:3'-5' exoribonuclease